MIFSTVNAHFKIFSRQPVRIALGMLVVTLLFAAKLPVRAASSGNTSWASEATGSELPLRMLKPADFDAENGFHESFFGTRGIGIVGVVVGIL